MIYKKAPGTETKNTKLDIINILGAMTDDIKNSDVIEQKRIQGMLRHIGLIGDLINGLLKRLIFKDV